MTYVELHCHSNFTFLEGAVHPEALIERAHHLGYPALAITDRNGLYGVVRFDQAAQEYPQTVLRCGVGAPAGELGAWRISFRQAGQALELADTLAHPFSKAYALGCAAWFNLYLRDTKTALARAREAVDLSIEQGFLWWQVWGTILGGRALADTGTPAVSVTQIKGGIDGWRMTGSGFTIPYFLALQAEACRKDGRTDEALALVAEARELIGKTDEGFYAGELHRLEGELRREKSGGADEAGVEACFERALDAARAEGARAFELRAATSLARLWSEQGKGGEARRLLAEACASFAGAPLTPDLAEARALLVTLPAA